VPDQVVSPEKQSELSNSAGQDVVGKGRVDGLVDPAHLAGVPEGVERLSDPGQVAGALVVEAGIDGHRHGTDKLLPWIKQLSGSESGHGVLPQISEFRCRCQTLLMPPSTTMSEPVMNELSSEARKRAALAISLGCASLDIGVMFV
jgi:hypothetical protein